MLSSSRLSTICVLAALTALTGCNDDNKSPAPVSPPPPPPPPPAATYSVGGTVTGLTGSLTLHNNGGDARTVNANGAFTFATSLNSAAAYSVTVSAQPAGQTCTVTSGAGNIAAANVTAIAVNCVTYAVSASIGAAGGTLTHPDGMSVVIPAGALSANTTIGISRPVAGWPLPFVADTLPTGAVFELTPHDIVFAKPVLFRYTPPAGSGDLTAQISSFEQGWQQADTVMNGVTAEVERHTFSWIYFHPLQCNLVYPITDPHACNFPRGHAWVSATPAGSVSMTSGNTDYSHNSQTAIGSAGTWAVNGATLTSLRLTLRYTAAPDCGGGIASLRRVNPDAPPSQRMTVVWQQGSLAPVDGYGLISATIPRADLIAGSNTYYVSYHCTRPGKPLTGGGDYVTFNVSDAPISGYTVGGTITGDFGGGLQLINGSREILEVPALAGSFTFTTAQNAGTWYDVRVLSQPDNAVCVLNSGRGEVTGNVTSIGLTCTPDAIFHPQGFTAVAHGPSDELSVFGRNLQVGGLDFAEIRSVGDAPADLAIAPNGVHLYVANRLSGTISLFWVRGADGYIPNFSADRAQPGVSVMAMESTGDYLFAASGSLDTLDMYFVDYETGLLNPVNSLPTGDLPAAVAVHPDGGHVYVLNQNDGSLSSYSYAENTPLTSMGAPLANVAASGQDLVIAPSGEFAYALAGNGEITRLAVSGAGAASIQGVTALSGVTEAYALAMHPAGGYLYATSSDANGAHLHVISVNAATGALSPLGSSALGGAGPSALAFSEDGALLYIGHRPSQSLRTYRVGSQGALTLIDTETPGGSITTIATGGPPN